jgi:hypothetical protein
MRIHPVARAAALVASLTLAIPACAGGDADPSNDSAGSTSAAAPAGETAPAAAPPAASAAPVELPHTAELGGRRLTILEFGTADPATQTLETVEEGNELVYIKARVENLDAETFPSSLAQFFLIDATGDPIAPALMFQPQTGDRFPLGDLARGESSEGYVGYQIPEGASVVLQYAVNLSENQLIVVPIR